MAFAWQYLDMSAGSEPAALPSTLGIKAGAPFGALGSALAGDTWESAVQSSYGYAVPRRFLWLLDFIVQMFAVFAVHEVAPAIQSLAGPHGPLRAPWLTWLSLPDASTIGSLTFSQLNWIPLVMAPSTLVFVQLLGGYRPLLD